MFARESCFFFFFLLDYSLHLRYTNTTPGWRWGEGEVIKNIIFPLCNKALIAMTREIIYNLYNQLSGHTTTFWSDKN